MGRRCRPKTDFLLIARRSPASCWYGHKDTCQGEPRASAARGYRRRSTVDRAFLGSNMHLGWIVRFRGRGERESGRTEMPLLRSLGCVYVDRICLLDHVLASPSGTHSRGADGIFLVPARSRRSLGKAAMTGDYHQDARTVSLWSSRPSGTLVQCPSHGRKENPGSQSLSVSVAAKRRPRG
jgi:hypothetical protein